MNPETSKTLNWQLSRRLGLDPSVPHTVNAETWCECWSSWTRDDSFRIWVEFDDGQKRVEGRWDYLTEFISSLVKEGVPKSLDGVAEATISPHAEESIEDGCRILSPDRDA